MAFGSSSSFLDDKAAYESLHSCFVNVDTRFDIHIFCVFIAFQRGSNRIGSSGKGAMGASWITNKLLLVKREPRRQLGYLMEKIYDTLNAVLCTNVGRHVAVF